MILENIELPNGKKIQIKRLAVDDFTNNGNYEFLHEWLRTVNTFLSQHFDPEELEKNKRKYFEHLQNNESVFIGAFYQQKIIGQVHLDFKSKTFKTSHVGTWGIAIHPDFQNQGLGAKLLQIIETKANEKGLKKLETEFVKENAAAEALYLRKLRYSIEGVRKNHFLIDAKNNLYTDAILIGKEI